MRGREERKKLAVRSHPAKYNPRPLAEKMSLKYCYGSPKLSFPPRDSQAPNDHDAPDDPVPRVLLLPRYS